MDSYNLQIGISIQRVCKFGRIYDVTSKFGPRHWILSYVNVTSASNSGP